VPRLLFVCGRNRRRSLTAQDVFSRYPGVEALSAGTDRDAETPLTGDLVEWADVIVAMERTHRDKLTRRFGALLRDKRVVVLGVPDVYRHMQAELVAVLKARVAAVLGLREGDD
jgi:predicted protein tyrosine phosphatase